MLSQDVQDVLSGNRQWAIQQADCIQFFQSFSEASVDFVFGSPPYENCRTYLENGVDLNIARKTDEWVEWMIEVYRAARFACKGMVAFVVGHGKTTDFKWSAAPALLAAGLHRAGFCLRDPKWFHRNGIPGSGGTDDFRKDVEWIICTTRGGKLPWSDNTAAGHPPKWNPGGAMSNRRVDGQRVNAHGVRTDVAIGTRPCGQKDDRENYRADKRRITRGSKEGNTKTSDSYDSPAIANPGNLVKQSYTADEVAELLAEASNITHCKVGGKLMGSLLSHHNEAPLPETLADVFVRSFSPPGGIVLDCFSGSGTTPAVAIKNNRRAIACDLRESQVQLTRRRLESITPMMLGM